MLIEAQTAAGAGVPLQSQTEEAKVFEKVNAGTATVNEVKQIMMEEA